MKLLFNFPQKKGKIYISHSKEKVMMSLNEVKIKNMKELNDNNGYFFECCLPKTINKDVIDKLNSVDGDAYDVLKENYQEWFDGDNNIDDIYIKSYEDDIPMTLILSNKIDVDIIINDEEKDVYELISFLNSNKKNKDLIINIDIVLLGIYICKTSIINKWAIKYVNIETTKENDVEWYRKDLEDEWNYDLIRYEEDARKLIDNLESSIVKAREIFKEVKEAPNLKIWENKINKLKSIILSIYDNRKIFNGLQ
jgi:hypothetical protein